MQPTGGTNRATGLDLRGCNRGAALRIEPSCTQHEQLWDACVACDAAGKTGAHSSSRGRCSSGTICLCARRVQALAGPPQSDCSNAVPSPQPGACCGIVRRLAPTAPAIASRPQEGCPKASSQCTTWTGSACHSGSGVVDNAVCLWQIPPNAIGCCVHLGTCRLPAVTCIPPGPRQYIASRVVTVLFASVCTHAMAPKTDLPRNAVGSCVPTT